MRITLSFNQKKFVADLTKPQDISIPLRSGEGPVAFSAPKVRFEPYEDGGFIGSLDHGSPVNFYNITINPHGNGTHTESVLHIDKDGPFINKALSQSHFISSLLTVQPTISDAGDEIVDFDSYAWDLMDYTDLDALLIRTLPNTKDKTVRNYSNTNPPYLSKELLSYLSERIDHLLIDLPSVDKEKDGGALEGHNSYWQTRHQMQTTKTITEMIYVEDSIVDGLYLLDLQILNIELDVSPSRPILFKLTENTD